jgi:hypothetical protein
MKTLLRRVLGVFLFALTSPLWVLGFALTPLAILRQWCFAICSRVAHRLLSDNRQLTWKESHPAADFLAKARKARRHARVVRP